MFTFHNIEKLLEDLLDFSVIVEGKRDKLALEKLGLTDIFTISGKPIEELVEGLPKDRKYIILTDFDKEGELLKSDIKRFMSKNGFRVNDRLRISVKNSFDIIQIEELKKISKIMEDDYYGKISTINYKIFNRSKVLHRRRGGETRCDRRGFWTN